MKNGLKSELSNGDLKYYNGETESCLPRENTVKDLTQRLATLNSPNEESPTKLTPPPRVGEMKGIISKAIEGMYSNLYRCSDLQGFYFLKSLKIFVLCHHLDVQQKKMHKNLISNSFLAFQKIIIKSRKFVHRLRRYFFGHYGL